MRPAMLCSSIPGSILFLVLFAASPVPAQELRIGWIHDFSAKAEPYLTKTFPDKKLRVALQVGVRAQRLAREEVPISWMEAGADLAGRFGQYKNTAIGLLDKQGKTAEIRLIPKDVTPANHLEVKRAIETAFEASAPPFFLILGKPGSTEQTAVLKIREPEALKRELEKSITKQIPSRYVVFRQTAVLFLGAADAEKKRVEAIASTLK